MSKASEESELSAKIRGWLKCSACGLPHWSVKSKDQTCLGCRYFDLVRVEKAALSEAISFLRDKGLCAYCGEYGSQIEHVVPRWSRLPTYTLLACQECNLMASGKIFGSFEDKASFIKGKIRQKYKFVLKLPEWTRDEIEEMGYVMRKKIEASQTARAVTRRRVEWSWVQAYILAGGE